MALRDHKGCRATLGLRVRRGCRAELDRLDRRVMLVRQDLKATWVPRDFKAILDCKVPKATSALRAVSDR